MICAIGQAITVRDNGYSGSTFRRNGCGRTIFDSLVQQQVRPLAARLPPRRDAAAGRDSVVEFREQFKGVFEDVALLFDRKGYGVLRT